MNRRITRVALLAAAALTVSLASPVAAQAAESTDSLAVPHASTAQRAAVPSAAPSATAPAAVSLQLLRGATYEHRVNYSSSVSSSYAINVAVSDPNFHVMTVTGNVYVGGRSKGTVRLRTSSTATGFLTWPRAYGPGRTQLGNIVVTGWFSGSAATTHTYTLPTASNAVMVKRARESSGFFVTKRGSKLSFSISGYRAYKANGKLAPSGKALIQRKVGKKWKTVKKVKIRKKGGAQASFSQSGKYRYRVIIKKTKTVDPINYITRKKI